MLALPRGWNGPRRLLPYVRFMITYPARKVNIRRRGGGPARKAPVLAACASVGCYGTVQSIQNWDGNFGRQGGAISGENGVGCRPVTPVVVTNAEEYAAFRLLRTGKTAHGADVLRVE